MSRTYGNILDAIGNTPIIKINKLSPEGVNMYVKAEGFNRRLFDSLDYVIKTEQFSPELVVEKLELVMDSSDEIRENLQQKMIEVRNRAMQAGLLLKKIISGSSILEP